MKVKWVGHSCFLIEAGRPALRVLIDPYQAGAYDGAIGYRAVSEHVDIVVVTHDHPDHAGIESLPGRPLIVRREASARGVAFESLELAHDNQGGRLRGKVQAFRFELEGIWVTHLGDLGHQLDQTQAEALRETHILFIPVGGLYTIDGPTAWAVCQQIRPNLVIPMHFRTSRIAMDLDSVDSFLLPSWGRRVERIPHTTLDIDRSSLPEPIVTVVLTPEN